MNPMIRRAVVFLAVAHSSLASSADAPKKREVRGMVPLAGGTFVMGTEQSRVEALCQRFGTTHRDLFLPEVPAHTVNVRPFSLDRTEVTNADFKAFVDGHTEWAPGRVSAERQNGDYLKHWKSGTFPSGAADVPVTYVTWWAAKAYCESSGRRLPSEAEWEFAARGGLASAEFPWGDEPPDSRRANWSGTGIGAPTRVGPVRAESVRSLRPGGERLGVRRGALDGRLFEDAAVAGAAGPARDPRRQLRRWPDQPARTVPGQPSRRRSGSSRGLPLRA
jgi:formylglycine-generating enzyme required for sulfatase activity